MKVIRLSIGTLCISSFLLIGCCGNSNKKESNPVESINSNEQGQIPSKAEQLISDQRPRFKIIESTIVEYLDKEITVFGYCSLDGFYMGGYENSQESYYCVSIDDNEGVTFRAYFEKSKNKELFNILSESDRVPLKLRIVSLSHKFHPILAKLFEGVSWQLIK